MCSTPEQLASRLPKRDSRTPRELFDLSSCYNAALSDGWTDGNPTNSLAALPAGVQRLAGVDFDIRGLVQLRSAWVSMKVFPQQTTNISVGLSCRKIHFLHGACMSSAATNGTIIAKLLVHQSGHSVSEKPVLFGSDVRDWWVEPKQQPDGPDPAVIAWQGTNTAGQALQIFKSSWENPNPQQIVESVEYVSAVRGPAPFLIAITAEP